MNKSIELLRYTDLSIIEIALSVGFSSASYYAETFRKWFGKSPSEFRNKDMQK
ncbi:MAG: helix-turn-helix transcriptional regulator [Lachnospiraceae bacterium]|nr:helix-turn-helix transcriptional regulator [Lachnospiraceae bacterium]MBD5483517.1 helix-turn-helix transcriptional regulator [Lachnospiraceae bacterium]